MREGKLLKIEMQMQMANMEKKRRNEGGNLEQT